MESPLVSILMTAYNREKYIGEAIESVLNSSYKNFELIIVDDGSTDNTVSIAKSFEVKDNRIHVYVNEKNLGDYHNRNKAASYATGKYLKYVDSDDIIYPCGLQVMVESMEKFPEAAFGFCDKKIQDDTKPYPIEYSGVEALRIHFFKAGLLHSGPTTSIIRASAFNNAGGFSGKRFVGDYELWLKFTRFAPLVLFQPGLVWWRIHPEQENEAGDLEHYSLKYNLNRDFLSGADCPLTENEKKILLASYRRLLGRRIYKRVLRIYGFRGMRKVLKECNVNPVTLFFEAFLPINRIRKIFGSDPV